MFHGFPMSSLVFRFFNLYAPPPMTSEKMNGPSHCGASLCTFSCISRRTRSPLLKVRVLIRPKSITILYCDFTLSIDIFHFKVLFFCCFGLFYTVCNFPVPEQQSQDLAVKSGYQVAESDQVQMR